MKLLPHDTSFFVLFEQQGQKTVEGCRAFLSMVEMGLVPAWMVMIVLQSTRTHVSSFFYPDPEHAWDGSSLP